MEKTARSVFNDELALLSLRTAQEVDRQLFGGNFDQTILAQFGNRLAEVAGVHDAPGTSLLSADPKATEIFSRAIEESSERSVADLESLRDSILRIIDPLVGKKEGLSTEALNLVKSFCLAFHKSLAAQRLPRVFERERPSNEVPRLNR